MRANRQRTSIAQPRPVAEKQAHLPGLDMTSECGCDDALDGNVREKLLSAEINVYFAGEVANPSMLGEIIAVGPAAKGSQVFHPHRNDDMFRLELYVEHIALLYVFTASDCLS
jgi:hypothetical protein